MKANELLTAKMEDGKITFEESYISASLAARELGVNPLDVDFSRVGAFEDEYTGEPISCVDNAGDVIVQNLGNDGLLTVSQAEDIVQAVQAELDRVEAAKLVETRQAWVDRFNAK